MTRTIYRTATALNGYIADEHNSLAWLFAVDNGGVDDHEAFLRGVGVGVIVEGSTTYEWVLRETGLLAQPEQWSEFYGDRPTFVFTSRALPVPAGADVRFLCGPLVDHLAEIQAVAGESDVWVVGGGDLAGQFLDADALDEIALTVAPVALTGGAPLLPRRVESDRLTLKAVTLRGQFADLVYEVMNHPTSTAAPPDSRGPVNDQAPRDRVRRSIHERADASALRQSSPVANRSAASISWSSARLTCPTRPPSRSAATAVVCSARTCVCSPPMLIVGRKIRGAADREVGATSSVDNSRSSDCTITP